MSRKNQMNYSNLLKSKQLSLTKSRKTLLKVLEETNFPVSGKEIEEKIKGKCDRATIYRNLSILSAKGIIQRILSGESIKYKFNPDNHKPEYENDHVHFQCNNCHKVICLEDLLVNDFILPEGFLKIENQFLIVGICKNCNNGEKNN